MLHIATHNGIYMICCDISICQYRSLLSITKASSFSVSSLEYSGLIAFRIVLRDGEKETMGDMDR